MKNNSNLYCLIIIFMVVSPSSIIAELITPENNSTLNYLHILFEWEQEPETDHYEIQISEYSDFSNHILHVDATTLVYIEKDALDWNKNYQWRIRPVNSTGESGLWTNSYSFSTGSSLSESTTIISNISEIQNGITVFGAFFNYFSAAIDHNGREIWNSGSESIVYYSTNIYGDVFGCTLVSAAENNLPGMEFTFDGETVWEEPNDEFLHHDIIQLPNGNYLGIVEASSLGPIPIGAWTPLFQSLGFQADGTTIEFPWIGDKLVEWDKTTKEVVWSWSVFDHFNMMDYDQFGGSWNQAYQDLHYDWTHVNAVIFDEEESAIYISTRHLSRITKIGYPSGNIIWNMGHAMASGDVTLGNDIGFSFQHSLQKLENGNILTFDNGNLAPEFRGVNEPISRAIEISVEENNAEIVWSYELPENLFGFASGNTQKLENENVLITTVGGGGRSLEVNLAGEIVWEANYNLSLPNGAVYRAHRIPGLFPAAYSVIVHDLYEMMEGNGVYLIPGSAPISFDVVNNGDYELDLNYTFTDQAGWFEPTDGNLVLLPGYSETLTFTGDISESTETAIIEFVITPAYHSEKQKIIQLIGVPITLGNNSEMMPSTFQLYKTFPNPFNPTTTISFTLEHELDVLLHIFDLKGQHIKTLVNQRKKSGRYNVKWDATNSQGMSVSTGVYFAVLKAGNHRKFQKMVYIK
ncbi:MAG: T9SS type A sorting domain-containing protein [Candidatus Marinimicrobia bacterium]|nr:T9SS type A sorting domain-containing protein [Candidatus Neomarinimicrobiota bacterium]